MIFHGWETVEACQYVSLCAAIFDCDDHPRRDLHTQLCSLGRLVLQISSHLLCLRKGASRIRIIRIIRTIVVIIIIIINNKWMSWLISMNTYLIIGWFIMSLYPHHHTGDCLGHQDWKDSLTQESWSIHFTSFFNRIASVEVTQIQTPLRSHLQNLTNHPLVTQVPFTKNNYRYLQILQYYHHPFIAFVTA